MNPNLIIDYLEQRAVEFLGHEIDGERCSFFVIDNPYDMGEFDKALRNIVQVPAMLVDGPEGFVSGNSSANNTDSQSYVFMVIDKRDDSERVRDVRFRCRELGLSILTKIRKDRQINIVPGKIVHFEMNSSYSPVGPISVKYYGYSFAVEFIIPITF